MELKKLYLLDANTLITSQGVYYPQAMVPELWGWVLHHGMNGSIKIPQEIYDEILAGKEDPLTKWLKQPNVKQHLLLTEYADPGAVSAVTFNGYAADLNENELAYIGRDPFLISYALTDPAKRCVVSLETSKPSAQRQNRKVPDVCKSMGVNCCNVFTMMRDLDFKTTWDKA